MSQPIYVITYGVAYEGEGVLFATTDENKACDFAEDYLRQEADDYFQMADWTTVYRTDPGGTPQKLKTYYAK